jgi:uncharacterized surface protein with fasciclin (FAS1) repeats
MATEPVIGAASADPSLGALVTTVKKADLVSTLNARSGITVFAPDNQAFDQARQSMGPDRFYALLADQNSLGDALEYHVLPQRYDAAGLLHAGGVSTMRGGTLQIKPAGRTIQVTDGSGQTATVLCGNLPTANATVFVIDKVLLARRP